APAERREQAMRRRLRELERARDPAHAERACAVQVEEHVEGLLDAGRGIQARAAPPARPAPLFHIMERRFHKRDASRADARRARPCCARLRGALRAPVPASTPALEAPILPT